MNEVFTFIDATHLISKARSGSKKHVSVDMRSGLINKGHVANEHDYKKYDIICGEYGNR